MVANEVAEILRQDGIFKAVDVVPPGFINTTPTDGYLISRGLALSQDSYEGVPQVGSSETVFIDYGGPNIAKPLHIGHLRSAIIGESLKRLAKAAGCRVIGDVHLGDWGLQIGLVIAELEERYPVWPCFEPDFSGQMDDLPVLTTGLLNKVYPHASKKSKEDEAFRRKAQEATVELQAGRKGYRALWREIVRVSTEDLKKNYEKLNVSFDLWLGESDSEKYTDMLLSLLTEKGLLYESDGAMVVDVSEETDKAPVPPVIIKKTDHSSIYATTDLAAIIGRQKDYAPDKLWYVVDSRQSLHFTQVFRCARKAGLVPEATELEHLGFGTMNGNDGKPYKTRDGGVMPLSELLDIAEKAAFERTNLSDFETEEVKREVSHKLAVAAIKFGDLINHRTKDYVFDLDKFLSAEGKTGIYLLYTVARIQSILKKANDRDERIHLHAVSDDEERELLLKLILSGEAFQTAFEEKAPNIVCENAYQIAAAFSRFYRNHHILSETDSARRKTWIGLCLLTKKMLLKHLDVLGIEAVDRM